MGQNFVKQKDLLGCGVACTASVLGSSYQEALLLFPKGKKKAQTVGFSCRDIANVLNGSGQNYTVKYIKDSLGRKIYKSGSIVFLKRSKRFPVGHYLVRLEKGWMDPWINMPEIKIKAGFRKRLPGLAYYAIINEGDD